MPISLLFLLLSEVLELFIKNKDIRIAIIIIDIDIIMFFIDSFIT